MDVLPTPGGPTRQRIWGGIGGAIGLSISDLFSAKYVTSAPKTFRMKFLIGLIAGFIAHKVFKITKTREPKKYFKGSLLASIASLLFNAIFDPMSALWSTSSLQVSMN